MATEIEREREIWNSAIDAAILAVIHNTDGVDPRLFDAMKRLRKEPGGGRRCPECGSPITEEERSPNGLQCCAKGHWTPKPPPSNWPI